MLISTILVHNLGHKKYAFYWGQRMLIVQELTHL